MELSDQQKGNIQPLAYCPMCKAKQPIRWKEDVVIPELQDDSGKEDTPDTNAQIDDKPLFEYDLFGDEYKLSEKETKGPGKPKQPLRIADSWFECAICGHQKIELEYIDLDEAIRRNLLREK